MLDVNPDSLERQFYLVIGDPSDNGFDGSAHVMKERIKRLVDAIKTEHGAVHFEMQGLADALENGDERVFLYLHVPQMKHQQVTDSRFSVGPRDAETDKLDRPFVTENRTLHVPCKSGGQTVYSPNDNAASVLLDSVLIVEWVPSDGQQMQLTLKYASSKPVFSLLSRDDSNTIKIITGEQPAPEARLRDILYLHSWPESELTKAREEYAPSYVPPWQPAVLAMSVGLCKKGGSTATAELSVALLLMILGDKLRYDPSSAAYWCWDTSNLWQQDTDVPRVALKAAATYLCEQAVLLTNRGRSCDLALDLAVKKYANFFRAKDCGGGEGDGRRGDEAEEEIEGRQDGDGAQRMRRKMLATTTQ